MSDYGVTIHDQGDLARIAELEAGVNVRDLCIDAWQRAGKQKDMEIVQAEAALAALKARRCEGCGHYATNEYGDYCEGPDTPWFEEQPSPDFCCNRWAERGTP